MKTVLVPTDFNVESLKIIDSLVLTNKPEMLNIIFMHAFKLSDSITDMLMLSRRSRDYEMLSDEFCEKMNTYRAKYPKDIQMMRVEYFYGSTVAAFRNFIDGMNADGIAYPKGYDFNPIHKSSIDPRLLTKRCGAEVIELDIHEFSGEERLFDTKMPAERKRVVSV
ncbi:hypothetical protein [Pedobacter gandavensis]|uniref:hypothetical protein n=1 Tax=Pedobacter gandavensis TaxID=2679963 RepID=UPI0029305DEA|nr:hypothetical protein [Pedobacter gandavensis]